MGKGEFLFLLKGLQWTIALSAVGFICGMVTGLGVAPWHIAQTLPK